MVGHSNRWTLSARRGMDARMIPVLLSKIAPALATDGVVLKQVQDDVSNIVMLNSVQHNCMQPGTAAGLKQRLAGSKNDGLFLNDISPSGFFA